MVWHEILAWVVIAVAIVVTVVWFIKLIACPKSACKGCNKRCILNKTQN